MELLVASAVFMLMVTLLLSMTSHANEAWQQTNSQMARRENARNALALLNRDLQAAVPSLPGEQTNAVPFQLLSSMGKANSSGLFWLAALPPNRTSGDLATLGYFVTENNKLYRVQTNAVVSNLPDLVDTTGETDEQLGLLAENILRLDVKLINADGTIASASAHYETNLPKFADITLVVADERTLKRQPDPNVTDLENPPKGVQVFRSRIEIPAAP